MQRFSLPIPLKRFLRIFSWIVAGGLLLFIALVAALPSILSTSFVQKHLRASLSGTLKREVSWSVLNLSWSDGLELRDFALGDGLAPLRHLAVGQVIVAPDIGFRDGRLRLDLALRCRNLSVQAVPGPATPPPQPAPEKKPFKEPLTALAEAVQNVEGMSWSLPVDLGVSVAVEPVELAYHDPKSGRNLALDNLVFHLDAPSLADQPVTVGLRSDLAVDGHALRDIAFSVDLKQLVTASRRIHPASALLVLRAVVPGLTLSLEGGLADPQGFAARMRADLARIMAAYGPLVPKSAPRLQGELAFDLLARADEERNLHISAEISGARLAVQGGLLGKKRLGPLDVQVRQKIVSDRDKQQVRLSEGRASIDRLLTASWEAVVDRPADKDRDLRARFGPLRIDLQQALTLAGPLLPAPLPVRELTGELTLRQLSAQLRGRDNRGQVALEKLALNLPRLRLALAEGGVTADGVELALDRVTVPLQAMQPAGVDVRLSYGLKRCAVSGVQPVVAEDLRGMLQLALTDIDLNSKSPRKVAARVALTQALDLGRVAVEGKLAVTALHENVTTHIQARESGVIEVALPELKVAIDGVQAAAGEQQLGPLPLSALVTAAGVRLGAAKGARPVVERATCTLTGGNFMRLSARAALTDGAPQRAVSDGSVELDLGRMLPLAASLLPAGTAADGTASVTWRVAAPTMPAPLPHTDNPLVRARAALGMIDRAELSIALDSRNLRWPLPDGDVSLADVHTGQPLRVVVPGNNGPISLGGDIAFAGLGGSAAVAEKLPVQSGVFSLQGELAGWRSLKLRETFRAEPYGLVQNVEATAGGIDKLLEQQGAVTVSALLRQLDVTATADVAAHFPAALTPVAGGAKLSGVSRAHLGLVLEGGRDLQVQASARTQNFGVGLASGTTLEGLNADLRFERRYALSGQGAEVWSPLSVSLVRPLPEATAPAGAARIASRVREDLRGQESGSQRFTIRKITVPNGAMPLELTALQGDLLLGREALGLGFFQGDVLGGTVRLRGMIDLQPDTPELSTACSFTNLQTLLLLPPDVRQQHAADGQDTAMTGEMTFDAPLRTGQRDLLEGLTLALSLRKIGTDTLERALFSLDPYERNEQIVGQRKLLRHGGLQGLRANIVDGAFGLEGDVQVKGVAIALPKVERVRLSELSIRKQMAKALDGIASLRKLLDMARADTLVIEPNETFSLVRREHE